MIPVVLEQMQGTFNSDANALILLETDRIHFKYILGSGLLGGNTGLEFESKNSISGRIMQTLEPYITLDFTNDPFRSPSIKNTQNIGPTVGSFQIPTNPDAKITDEMVKLDQVKLVAYDSIAAVRG